MPGEAISAVFHGLADLKAGLDRMNDDVAKATRTALRANQNLLKRAVQAELDGPPRWNHRGASRIYSKPVNVEGPAHSPRGGPPGKFTGTLQHAVGGVRKPLYAFGTWHGGVGVGGSRIETNIYKTRLEQRYPYFRPALAKVAPEFRTTFAKSYARAIARYAKKG